MTNPFTAVSDYSQISSDMLSKYKRISYYHLFPDILYLISFSFLNPSSLLMMIIVILLILLNGIYLSNPFHYRQDMTQSQFLSKVQLVWIQFSFLTSCLTKAKNTVCLAINPWLEKEKRWIHAFPKGISIKWNANSLVQELNLACRVHFLLWKCFTMNKYIAKCNYQHMGCDQKVLRLNF